MTITVNVLSETKVPTLPSVQQVQDPAARAFMEAISELTEVREGLRGDALDENVTWRDLYRNGMLNISIDYRPYIRTATGFLPLPYGDGTDFTAPPAVTGLAAVGALANVIITFDQPKYHNHAFTEIWRAGTDDLGLAVMVGTTESSVYADNLGQTGLTRYYWARNVSRAGVSGPYNAIAGTVATTGFIVTGDIADASITTQKLADGAVTTVKYADASITTVKIGDSQVSTAKIADASVITTKIGDLAVTTAKVNDLAITTGKYADLSLTTGKVAPNAIDASKLNVQTHGITGLTFTNNSPVAGSVAWSSHTISWNGNTYSIGAGNTAAEMIWLDRSVSTVALQGSTRAAFESAYDPADGDILLAVNSGGISETIYNATLVTPGGIKTGAIVADKIAAAAVVAGKIATNAIVAGDGVIATAAIGTALIQDAAITNAKIGLLAVDAARIADLAVATGKIADLAVTAAKIADATITTAKIGLAQITTALIADAAITSAKILDAAITTAKIGLLQVTSAEIADATITGGKIAASTITSDKISVSQLSAISADMGAITAGTITLNSSGHIKAGQTAFDTGTGFFIEGGATPRLSLGSSAKGIVWDGSAFTVRGDVIATGNIQTSAVSSDKIASSAVATDKIASSAVSQTQSSYSEGNHSPGGYPATLASVSITTAGGTVLIHFSAYYNGSSRVSIKRGSTVLATFPPSGFTGTAILSGTVVDTPVAGSYTYNFVAEAVSGGSIWNNRTLVCTELKR